MAPDRSGPPTKCLKESESRHGQRSDASSPTTGSPNSSEHQPPKAHKLPVQLSFCDDLEESDPPLTVSISSATERRWKTESRCRRLLEASCRCDFPAQHDSAPHGCRAPAIAEADPFTCDARRRGTMYHAGWRGSGEETRHYRRRRVPSPREASSTTIVLLSP